MTRTLPASERIRQVDDHETTPSDAAIGQSFRKRPVVIQAALFDGTKFCADEIAAWAIDSENFSAVVGRSGKGERCFDLRIRTLEGSMTALPGDWIIRGVQGEFYPCKPDIFAKTYEPATAREIEQGRGAVAELPPLPDPIRALIHDSVRTMQIDCYTAGQMTAYGEACRRMGNRDE